MRLPLTRTGGLVARPPKAPAIYSNCKESNQTPFSTSMFLNTFAFLPEGTRTHRKPSTLATSSSGTSQPRIGGYAVSFFLAIHGLCVCALLRAKPFSLALPALWGRATLTAWACHLLHLLQPARPTPASCNGRQRLRDGSHCLHPFQSGPNSKVLQTRPSLYRLHPSHLWESPALRL